MPGVAAAVVDNPAYSLFIWPCFAGLNNQASEQIRGEMRY